MLARFPSPSYIGRMGRDAGTRLRVVRFADKGPRSPATPGSGFRR